MAPRWRRARQLVVYHRRPGGQSQYSLLLALNPSSDRMRAALSFAREHLHLPLSVADLADAACLSERQFGRLFRAETGQTPAKVIEQLRVEAAGGASKRAPSRWRRSPVRWDSAIRSA